MKMRFESSWKADHNDQDYEDSVGVPNDNQHCRETVEVEVPSNFARTSNDHCFHGAGSDVPRMVIKSSLKCLPFRPVRLSRRISRGAIHSTLGVHGDLGRVLEG